MRCKFHSGLFPPAPLLPNLPSQPFPLLSSFFYFLLLVFFIYDRLCPLFLKSFRGRVFCCRRPPRRNYRDRLARADTLFRGSSRFSEGRARAKPTSARTCRGCDRRSRWSWRRWKKSWNGETPVELINSDGLLSTDLFKWQYAVTFVIDEERLSSFPGSRITILDALLSTEQSSIRWK